MAQYRTGTVDVVNGSSTITGVGTAWQTDPIDPIAVNDLFVVDVSGEDVLYTVASVVSDTSLTISVPFGGSTANGLNYAIVRNFTPGGIPLMNAGDIALPQIYNRAIADLESAVQTTPFTLPVADTAALVQDDVDATKLVRIDVGDTPTATTAAILMPRTNVDFRAPDPVVRRLMGEPIEGNSLSGAVEFDGDPTSSSCMLGELLQCDNSSQAFNLNFDPANIITPDDWQGLLCWVRPTSDSNLASISVTGGFAFSWQNGYPAPNQGATTLYLGLAQTGVDGLVIPVFKRTLKLQIWGPVRESAAEDLLARFGTTDANAQGGVIRNYRVESAEISGTYTFLQTESGGTKVFNGSSPTNWTVPALLQGSQFTVHNFGTADLTFVASGVTFIPSSPVLPGGVGATCTLDWPTAAGTTVKVTGELA